MYFCPPPWIRACHYKISGVIGIVRKLKHYIVFSVSLAYHLRTNILNQDHQLLINDYMFLSVVFTFSTVSLQNQVSGLLIWLMFTIMLHVNKTLSLSLLLYNKRLSPWRLAQLIVIASSYARSLKKILFG